MKLALFDFDGTITTRDTYTKFVISNASIFRLILGGFLLSPLIILNKLKLLPSPLLRPVITKLAFKGTKVELEGGDLHIELAEKLSLLLKHDWERAKREAKPVWYKLRSIKRVW